MGPKKRTGAATEAVAQSKKSTQRPTSEPQPSEESFRFLPPVLTPDNWTEEQEITLFKAIIKWKPAGMHKHFRMLSIANLMKNHGVADTHTNIPGIWAKLATLYNLEAADDQEEMLDEGYESPNPVDFDLPDEYYDLKMARRFPTSPSPETEDDKPTKPIPTATRKAATTKPKKETKAETTRRGTKRRKVEEEEQKEDGAGEEGEEESDDETEEETSAPAPTVAAKRKGRARAKSTGPGTAKSTPAPDDNDDAKKKGKGKPAVVAKAKQQGKRGRPTTKKKEVEEEEVENDETAEEEEESGESEAASEEASEPEEEEEEASGEEGPASPASTRRSRSVASTRVPPKGKKAKAPKGGSVRRSTRKK
ncbi:hypothetical protein TWF696_006935 [Orbilia brochopaga]|uniref:Uncharacterized protein n=1 Tax=Orbilia brochopaga TaxID=3140254 RepID=A0AAV9UQB9_9PEZI